VIYFLTVNYYSTDWITQLLASIEANVSFSYRFILVNNSPSELSVADLKRETVEIINSPDNLGFGGGCNLGLNWIYDRDPQGIVWLVNPDTTIAPNSSDRAATFFKDYPEISILGSLVYEPSGKVWFAGGQFQRETGAIVETKTLKSTKNVAYFPCDWVSGCSLLIHLKNFKNCPQFDPEFFIYYEDFDFCRRYAEKGHAIALSPEVQTIHHPSSIVNRNLYLKYKYSTYSYLLTMQRHASGFVLFVRLMRLLFHAIALLGFKPNVAIGKLEGIANFLTRSPQVS